ncbi:MAG: hypothetical protein WBG65_09930 [Sulfurimonadaceae bacterium]
MVKRHFTWMKAVVLSGLMGLTSLVHADVAYSEQILTGNGGVSVSLSGEWAAVGAYDPLDSSSCDVTMYQLDYATMTWNLHSTLGAAGGNCNGNKGFGAAISLSGSDLVVGLADYSSGKNKDVGAFSAYAYDSALDSWEPLIEQVLADDPQAFSGFGTAVHIQNGILLVGAPTHDGTAGIDTGKIYLYERPASFVTTLSPTVTVEGNQSDSLFGSVVAGDYEDILVGASGYDQGIYTDNGAGFMYLYNPSVPSLTLTGELYGTDHNESLGVQLDHAEANAVISGNLRSYGYHFVDAWHRDLTLEGTGAGDVCISDNVSALAIQGNSVNLYPSLDSFFNSYFLAIVPGNTGPAFAEDLSLSKNHLLVSEEGSNRVRMYMMPCGYGGTLVENEWTMVNIPCKVSSPTVMDMFGYDLPGTYDTNWVVYEQNTSNYSGKSVDAIKMELNSTMVQDKSYWIIADTNSSWRVNRGVSQTRTDLNTSFISDPVMAGAYAIALPTADQNVSGDIYAKVMVGNTFAGSFEWTNVQYYSVSDANISLATAKTSSYMESTAYTYDSSITTGQPYTAVTDTPGVGSKTIDVNEGFWIKMLVNAQPGDKLLIPYQK